MNSKMTVGGMFQEDCGTELAVQWWWMFTRVRGVKGSSPRHPQLPTIQRSFHENLVQLVKIPHIPQCLLFHTVPG